MEEAAGQGCEEALLLAKHPSRYQMQRFYGWSSTCEVAAAYRVSPLDCCWWCFRWRRHSTASLNGYSCLGSAMDALSLFVLLLLIDLSAVSPARHVAAVVSSSRLLVVEQARHLAAFAAGGIRHLMATTTKDQTRHLTALVEEGRHQASTKEYLRHLARCQLYPLSVATGHCRHPMEVERASRGDWRDWSAQRRSLASRHQVAGAAPRGAWHR